MDTILVVDDVADNRALLEDVLVESGYRVELAASGREALAYAAASPPDAILLDVLMPEMDGIETCRVLRSRNETSTVPIIMVSGVDGAADIVRGLDAGANDYISKPIQESIVLARLRSALRTKELIDANASLAAQLTERVEQLDRRSEELAHSNEELQQFASIVSHDLKAPLRAISTLSTWLEVDLSALLSDEAERNLMLLRGRVVRMEELLDRLLAYCRVGTETGRSEHVDLDSLLAEVVALVGIPKTMKVSLPAGLPKIVTMKAPLEHVLLNLVNNAVKHHDREDGTIAIQVGRKNLSGADGDSEQLVFEVSDDGPGIDPRYHDRVFRIFETLTSRDQVEGSGMGLALVKKIVQSQGGRIWLESEGGGRGTRFLFSWPVSD